MRQHTGRRTAFLAALLIFALAMAGRSAVSAESSGSRWGAGYFPNVSLMTQDGKAVRFYDDLLKGKAVAVNVIYTSCKDECPLETAQLVQVQKLLGDLVGKGGEALTDLRPAGVARIDQVEPRAHPGGRRGGRRHQDGAGDAARAGAAPGLLRGCRSGHARLRCPGPGDVGGRAGCGSARGWSDARRYSSSSMARAQPGKNLGHAWCTAPGHCR